MSSDNGHTAPPRGDGGVDDGVDEAAFTAALKALRSVSTATITTQLFGRGLRSCSINGVSRLAGTRDRLVGEAFTLRYVPAREDLDQLSAFDDYDHPQRAAIEAVPEGAVLVVDARGQTRAASLGNILATRLSRRGVAGVVTDGAVRDVDGFVELGLPTFAAGGSPTTNLSQHHAVDMQLPIGCGEVAVFPGDVIVADSDGVVVVPRHLAVEVAEAGVRQERLEDFIVGLVEAGRPLRGTYPADQSTLTEYQESGA